MNSNMDINSMLKFCRLCLVKEDVNIPIFEDPGDIRQIFLKISSCLPVKVSRDDQLPKKICDGCSYKLDMLYEFCNTSVNAEKQLLTWLGEVGIPSKITDTTAQQLKPADAFVKQETIDPPDIHMEDDDDDDADEDKGCLKKEQSNVDEVIPPKRARRTAAVKAAIALDQNSEDDEDSEPMTKVEDDSDDSDNDDHEPAFVDVPSTSADDQPGPSGVGKDGVEAPSLDASNDLTSVFCSQCSVYFGIEHPCTKTSLICTFCKGTLKKIALAERGCFASLLKPELNQKISVGGVNIIKKNDEGQNDRGSAKKWKYRCAECNIKFESRYFHRKHKYQVHKVTKYKICPLCGKSIVGLSQHLKGVHGNPDSVKCSDCDKTFSCSKHLKRHMLVHSNTFNHICTTCGKGFKTPFSMRVHMRSHDEIKPFECPLCLKTFTTKQWRNNHMKTHR